MRRAKWNLAPVVAVVLFGPFGCTDERRDAPAQAVVTEINGELRVEVGPLDELSAPGWEPTAQYNTGDGPAPLELFRVTGGRFLQDGSLAVANSGAQEILILGPDGTLQRRIGRSGDGPGEFREITSLDVDRAGNLLAYDARLGRLTTLDPDGTVIGTRRLAPPNQVVDLFPLAVLDDDRVLAVYGDLRIFASEGERRDSTPLFLFDTAGDPTDTVGVWAAQEWAYTSVPGGSARTLIGFGRALAYAGRNGHSVLGSTDSLDLTLFDATGRSVMRVSGGGPNPPVTDADVAAWRASQAEQMSSAPAELRQVFMDAPHRPTYPAFSALLVDDRQRVWIGSAPRQNDAERDWIVVGTDGTIEASVQLPAQARLLDVADDQLAVLMRNELDEEHIIVLRLTHTAGISPDGAGRH